MDHSLAQDGWRQGALSNRWACNQGHDFLVQKQQENFNFFFFLILEEIHFHYYATGATPGDATQK